MAPVGAVARGVGSSALKGLSHYAFPQFARVKHLPRDEARAPAVSPAGFMAMRELWPGKYVAPDGHLLQPQFRKVS
jgi:hypothetical protein